MPVLPALTQHDYAYFDFIDGLRTHNYTAHVKALVSAYEQIAGERDEIGRKPTTLSEVEVVMGSQPLFKWACVIQRNAQEMMWAAGRDSVAHFAEELEDLLSDMPDNPVGLLVL